MRSRMSAISVAACAALVATVGIAFADPVDEAALREYARLKRTDRVAAETRRLELLHPGWRAPADLWTARPSGPDEASLWDLYEAGDLDLLRKSIAERQAKQSGWKPSDDLVQKIKAKEIRAAMLDRAANGRWIDVARLASDNGLADGTPDIELLWIVAEAFAHTEHASGAAALYKFVLENRTDPRERIATIQKALAVLPMAEAEKLIAMGQVATDGRNEFDVIGVDITRARISAFLRNDQSNAIGTAELAAFEELARQSSDPKQAELIGWYAFRRGELNAALDWFKWSIAHGGNAMTAHGLALTLVRLGFRREAEEVAYAWREQLVNNTILFIDVVENELTRETPPPIEPARIARYAQVAMKTQSGEGAQALAWYAYNSCQFDTALEWFQRAAAWFPKEATIYGYALTLQRMKRRQEFLEIVNRYDGLFSRVVGLLFKDDLPHPPTPCDKQANPQVAGSYGETRRNLDPGAGAPGIAHDAGRGQGWGRVPHPTGFNDASVNFNVMRPLARSGFPLAVSPENPLRFAPREGMPLDRASGSAQAFRIDQAINPPLIARRVPGADAMPYERFGIALLPAWNGATSVSFPIASDRSAAIGTIWSEEGAAAARNASVASATERVVQARARFHP